MTDIQIPASRRISMQKTCCWQFFHILKQKKKEKSPSSIQTVSFFLLSVVFFFQCLLLGLASFSFLSSLLNQSQNAKKDIKNHLCIFDVFLSFSRPCLKIYLPAIRWNKSYYFCISGTLHAQNLIQLHCNTIYGYSQVLYSIYCVLKSFNADSKPPYFLSVSDFRIAWSYAAHVFASNRTNLTMSI